MVNTALTGATYDIDGGQQLLPRGCEHMGEWIWVYALGTVLKRQRAPRAKGATTSAASGSDGPSALAGESASSGRAAERVGD
jgi:hypothetical protein